MTNGLTIAYRFYKVDEQAEFVLDLLKSVSRDYRIKIADLAGYNILDLGQLAGM